MKISPEDFLKDLTLVKAGLSPREFIEQSSCFVFRDGWVMTFNDEVACRKKLGGKDGSTFKFTGAVPAETLLAILEKLPDTELDMEENDKGELEFVGNGKAFGIIRDAEIFLPIDKVEKPSKDQWMPLPKDFMYWVGLVNQCVSVDESRFLLTCVHLTPDFVEGCDNQQVMRRKMDTGLDSDVLVRGTSLSFVSSLDMAYMALTKSWIHFRNNDGLVYSCRRYVEEYPVLDKLMDFTGEPIVMPKGVGDACDRAVVFAQDKAGDAHVSVLVAKGKIRVKGEGLSGWFKETKDVDYEGPPLDFVIAPNVLKKVCTDYEGAEIKGDKLRVAGKKWVYVTVLGHKEDAPPKEEKKKGKEDR